MDFSLGRGDSSGGASSGFSLPSPLAPDPSSQAPVVHLATRRRGASASLRKELGRGSHRGPVCSRRRRGALQYATDTEGARTGELPRRRP